MSPPKRPWSYRTKDGIKHIYPVHTIFLIIIYYITDSVQKRRTPIFFVTIQQ